MIVWSDFGMAKALTSQDQGISSAAEVVALARINSHEGQGSDAENTQIDPHLHPRRRASVASCNKAYMTSRCGTVQYMAVIISRLLGLSR